jgi:ubiquinol-cytochrome c reductase cytochrome b subunit
VLGLFIVLVLISPFIEAWVTGDKREHHIAQRPRNAATRTAIGAAGVTFYAVLWAAAASDIIATHFYVTMEGVIHTLQALLFLGPIIAYFVTKRICIALQKKDREIVLHGYESGRIVRLPGGEYIEVHQPVDEYERWKLVDNDNYEPLIVRPNARGRIPWHENIRAVMSRWFFEDRLAPLTQAELDEAASHQQHEVGHIAVEEDLELQGAHERAGVPDAPHVPIDDGHQSEFPVRPTNVIVADDGTKKPRNREKEQGS